MHKNFINLKEMETKTLRERMTEILKEETKNERETPSERNTLSHTHIEPLRPCVLFTQWQHNGIKFMGQ
jgi:hypothetical protein